MRLHAKHQVADHVDGVAVGHHPVPVADQGLVHLFKGRKRPVAQPDDVVVAQMQV
jgi:hypothetical protein